MTGGAHDVLTTGRAGGDDRQNRKPGPVCCATCNLAMHENHNTRTCRLCEQVAHLGCGQLVGALTKGEIQRFKGDCGWICKGCMGKTGRVRK